MKWQSIRDEKGGWIFAGEIKADNRIATIEKDIEANTNLIASAPELLEACESAKEYFDNQTMLTPDEESLFSILEQAINKSKGN